MTKKQVAIFVLLWLAVIAVVFVTPAKGADSSIVSTTQSVLCENSVKDLAASKFRALQLKQMLESAKDPSARLVLSTELKAVISPAKVISMWRVENCRDA